MVLKYTIHIPAQPHNTVHTIEANYLHIGLCINICNYMNIMYVGICIFIIKYTQNVCNVLLLSYTYIYTYISID